MANIADLREKVSDYQPLILYSIYPQNYPRQDENY